MSIKNSFNQFDLLKTNHNQAGSSDDKIKNAECLHIFFYFNSLQPAKKIFKKALICSWKELIKRNDA